MAKHNQHYKHRGINITSAFASEQWTPSIVNNPVITAKLFHIPKLTQARARLEGWADIVPTFRGRCMARRMNFRCSLKALVCLAANIFHPRIIVRPVLFLLLECSFLFDVMGRQARISPLLVSGTQCLGANEISLSFLVMGVFTFSQRLVATATIQRRA